MNSLTTIPVGLRRFVVPAATAPDGRSPHPDMALLLALMNLQLRGAEPGPASFSASARRQFTAGSTIIGGDQPIGSVTDRSIDGPGGPLMLRFYTPRGLTQAAAGFVFCHGGGFVYGDLDSHDAVCRVIAEQAQVRVISVDYRLAPEHPFPAAVDDAIAAWGWITRHAKTLNLCEGHIAIGGDSAGANLATVVSQEMVHSGGVVPSGQLLIYPVVDFTTRRPSRDTFAKGYYLTSDFMDQVKDTYLVGNEDLSDPRLSPLLGDLRGLPPTVVSTAGFDPLRDEGIAYVEALRAAGVSVEHLHEDDLVHGYVSMTAYGTACPAAVSRLVAALQRLL